MSDEIMTGVAVERRSDSTAVAANSGSMDMESLFKLAMERPEAVEIIERLSRLQQEQSARMARSAFFEAIAAFQEECPDIRKTSKAKIVTRSGADYGYSYAALDSIARVIRPILKKHGLSYSFDVQAGAGVLTVICVLRHVLGHEERATFPVPVDADAKMSAAQKNGAALTYGRRQSLVSVLGLTTTDEDTDAAQREPRTVATATKEEIANVEALLDEVGTDRARFLKYLGIKTLDELPASTVPLAIRTLESKRQQGGPE